MWQRVQLTHAKASKESLTPEQRKQEKHVKHQSYLSAQDRSALSAALHNFIKQYVLDPSKICHKEADGTFACVTSFLRRCFK